MRGLSKTLGLLAALSCLTALAGQSSLTTQAIRYEHGEGVERNLSKAAELYCAAAALGEADAAYRLGWMYANGRGLARDDAVAVGLFRRAAAAGHAHAGLTLQKIRADSPRLPPCLTASAPAPAVAATEPRQAESKRMLAHREEERLLLERLESTKAELERLRKLALQESAKIEIARAELAKAEQQARAQAARLEAAKGPAARLEAAKGPAARLEAAKGPAAQAEAPVAPAGAEAQQVNAAIAAWAAAWSGRDIGAYLAAYAKDFAVPAGRSREQWEQERRARIADKAWIEVKIEAVQIAIDGAAASARFRQDYRSDKYSERSGKTLALIKAGGKWLISEERSGD